MTEQPAERSAVSGVVVADNEQKLRQQISQTREELGDTVAQLVAKANLKHQVQVKSAALAGRVKATASAEPMRHTAMKGVSVARERRVPLIAAGATAGLAGLALLWWKQRSRQK
jgi:hypothetical protein